jgi:hypothetical protein
MSQIIFHFGSLGLSGVNLDRCSPTMILQNIAGEILKERNHVIRLSCTEVTRESVNARCVMSDGVIRPCGIVVS